MPLVSPAAGGGPSPPAVNLDLDDRAYSRVSSDSLMKLVTLSCARCKHRWTPRTWPVRICAKCKSPFWRKKSFFCRTCGQQWDMRFEQPGVRRMCRGCYHDGQNIAMAIVASAIKAGHLPKLNGRIRCADCGTKATMYDHRDYNRPLEVTPVCQACNIVRGRAKPIRKSTLTKMKQPNGTGYRLWISKEK